VLSDEWCTMKYRKSKGDMIEMLNRVRAFYDESAILDSKCGMHNMHNSCFTNRVNSFWTCLPNEESAQLTSRLKNTLH
jgi:hypothetical protein